ncbi:MAG: hypothetical protein GQ532_08150 [Methylomarinum sp.]|nr:hypothetical protein [Methylomarinum sp.]
MVNNKKIGWVLTSDYNRASSRLQGYRIHEYFIGVGLDSSVIAENFYEYEKNYSKYFFSLLKIILKEKYDVVFFQKPGWMSFKLSELLRLNGVKTVAIQCDPFPGEYSNYFDTTIVTTVALKKLLKLDSATIIDDMLETPVNSFKTDYRQVNDRLKIVWIGQGTPIFIQDFIKKLYADEELKDKIDVISISNAEWATCQWSLETVYEDILQCDVAIIPLPAGERFNIKSTNRLTLFMSLGMPTIITPIQSYLDIAQDRVNCLIADSLEDFSETILECKNESIREKIGVEANHFAKKHYSPSVVGKLWLKVLADLFDSEQVKINVAPKLHVRIINYVIKYWILLRI